MNKVQRKKNIELLMFKHMHVFVSNLLGHLYIITTLNSYFNYSSLFWKKDNYDYNYLAVNINA